VGESKNAALVREIREELNCTVEVVDWLTESVAVSATHVLHIAHAVLRGGEPRCQGDHDELRWLSAEELGEVSWLPADLDFLPAVAELLKPDWSTTAITTTPSVRGIVFEEADARLVLSQLLANGYSARIERERLAGEDDDEAHAWAVLTDAPTLMVEVLIDRFDGWLDAPEPDVSSSLPLKLPPLAPLPPFNLPSAPKRLKREP
jgi:8-oxo-dGTP diphosphatase